VFSSIIYVASNVTDSIIFPVYIWRGRLYMYMYIYHTTYTGATLDAPIVFGEECIEQEKPRWHMLFCGPCKVKLCIFLLLCISIAPYWLVTHVYTKLVGQIRYIGRICMTYNIVARLRIPIDVSNCFGYIIHRLSAIFQFWLIYVCLLHISIT
jgi:hypothetical protein